MKNVWSESDVSKLKELWPIEKAEYIAMILGRTKNAIFGRAFREGLMEKKAGRPVGIKKDELNRVASMKAVHKALAIASAKEPPRTHKSPVPLMEANAFQCRAIVPDQVDRDGLAIVCGKTIGAGANYSFCPEHLKIFTVHRVR